MCIAVEKGESEIFVVVTSAMLASDDVFDVIDEEWLCVLRKAAVFAAMIGTSTGRTHLMSERFASRRSDQEMATVHSLRKI